ncbi:MAG TPA: ABC transporter permease [Blastocatellia bacterium]|nr:ABC transporter permease [Blastocatellia bacterium]
MWSDVRFAWRSLRHRPGFVIVVVFTLALGIGANSAIFSVVNTVLLSPLPYSEPERLVALFARDDKRNLNQRPVSYANFQDWRAQGSSFAQMAAVRGDSFSLLDRGEPERVNGVRVTTNILTLLGVRPIAGRDFLPEEGQPEKASVALISYGLWQRRYGADPHLIGQSVTLEGRPYTVIGVLPAWLKFPGLPVPTGGADVWFPFVPLPGEQNRSFANTRLIGRLKDGVSLAQAQTGMDVIAARLEQQYPTDNTNLRAELLPLTELLVGNVRLGLRILFGAVGVVLLIACVNVANLLLARAAGRQTEIAIRVALGANRWRVVRQMLTECVLLSLAGGALGLLLAWQGIEWLARTRAAALPRLDELRLDGRVLAFTLLISILTALLFGLLSALRASRPELVAALKESRKGTAGSVNQRWLNSLAATEIALALVLLVGAGLLWRSFRAVSAVDPGFKSHHVLTLALPLSLTGYPDQASQFRFYEKALARFNAVPGVTQAAAVFRVPLVGLATVTYTAQGQPVPPGSDPVADYRPISANYFEAIGIPLLRGRAFNEHDTVETADVLIVNEELARRRWPGENPIGKRLQLALERTRWREIVGVVGNARLSGLEAGADPAIYLPLAQNTWPNALRNSSLVVRTQADPQTVTKALREELRNLDPTLPVTQVRTLDEILDDALAPRRFTVTLFLLFALVAGLLALIGIYGVISCSVAARTSEIGLRMALGAQPRDILRLVIIAGLKLTTSGISLGLLGAGGLTRLMKGLLFGVSALDPLVFIGLALLLTATALLATCLPARRAARTNPIAALKYD